MQLLRLNKTIILIWRRLLSKNDVSENAENTYFEKYSLLYKDFQQIKMIFILDPNYQF